MPTADIQLPHTLVGAGGGIHAVAPYDNTKTYQVGDVIVADNFTWMCMKPNCVGAGPGGLVNEANRIYYDSDQNWVWLGDSRPKYAGAMTKVSQVIQSGVDTKVLLDTPGPTTGVMRDDANNGLYILTPSSYLVTAEVHFESGLTPGVGIMQVVVYKYFPGNPAELVCFEERPITGSAMHFLISSVASLTGGQKLKMHVYHTNGAARTMSSTNPARLQAAGLGGYFV